MIRAALVFLALSHGLAAQEVTTDAFGVLPTAQMGPRADWAGYQGTVDGRGTVQPHGPADAALLFVGPKSIVAGIEPGHGVALLLDGHGNLVTGAETAFTLGFGGPVTVTSRFGIADHLFTPPPQAQNYLAGAATGAVQSPRADYRVTAHLATVPLAVRPNAGPVLADRFAPLVTAPLSDAYGNPVEDGVGLSAILRDAGGTQTVLPMVVRDGAARGTLLSRDISGAVTGDITLAGRQAAGIALQITPMAVTDLGDLAIWAEPEIEAVRLRVGPLQTDQGYVAPDGTAVTVAVAPQDQAEAATPTSGWVLDGYVSFLLPLHPDSGPFDVTLSLLGDQRRVAVEVGPPPRDLTVRGAE